MMSKFDDAAGLTLDTVLHRASDFRLEVDSSNEVTITVRGMKYHSGAFTLRVLDRCYNVASIRQILKHVCCGFGEREVQEAIRCVKTLLAAGVLLRDPPSEMSSSMFPFGGYSSPYVQIKMLNDIMRKKTYLEAISDVVKEGDVVLDLGTGSGIMAIAAVKAGARRVYAVEPSGIIGIAEENAKRNGASDRITFIKGWSSRVNVPERPNVLVTDLIGNDPLDLEMWELISDVRTRVMSNSFACIPSRIKLFARAVRVPDTVVRQHVVTPFSVETWEKEYGIDFSFFLEANGGGARGWYEKPRVVSGWNVSAEKVCVGEVDLVDPPSPFRFTFDLDEELMRERNGIVVFYAADLLRGSFSSDPLESQDYSHWYSSVWLLPEWALRAGRLRVEYRYIGEGESTLDVLPVGASCSSRDEKRGSGHEG